MKPDPGMRLYDVNLLFAMLNPDHERHADARRWRSLCRDKNWATCEITVAGFVRLSCNPALSPAGRLPSEAFALLRANQRATGHAFLSFGGELPASAEACLARCRGYRQVTDALLIALAMSHGATLATFDTRMAHIAPDPKAVEVVPVM